MPTQDEEIGRHLSEALASGELKAAKSFGKPMEAAQGWHETPDALRMPFKILKDSGFVPPEVEMFHERAALTAAVQAATGAERIELQRKLSDIEQSIALRLEALRVNGSL